MSLKAYNAVFHEPPTNINNSIGISASEHPALISLFKPNDEIITSIYVLVNNDVLSGTTTKSNNLKLSIISVDSTNSYLPSDHAAAQTEAAKNQNSFDDYVAKLHEESLSGVVSKTNINSINGQTWIEFKFTAGFITDPANVLNPDSYYGILISDTSESNLINNVFYTDKTYNQDSLKRTLFLKIDDDELTWQNFQIGDNNVQLCVSYATSELNTTSELNYGSISTGGPNAKRNTGIGMFIRNTSDTATYTVDNFTPVPRSGDTDTGLENFTYNSNFKWTYFDPNELPSTSSEIQSANSVSSGINVELDPDDFVFLYQKDWIAPLPVQYSNKLSRQALHIDATDDEDELKDIDASAALDFPADRYKYDEIKLHSENYFYNFNNAIQGSERTISKAFSTNYPTISLINANLQTIKARQIIKNADDEFQFNVFEIIPWTTDFFTDSTTGQRISDDIFANDTYYLNSTVEREEWAVDNSLISNPPDSTTDFEKNTIGFLKSYGTEIDASSDSTQLIFSNTKIFPKEKDSARVTDIRNVGTVYRNRNNTDYEFRLSRNNSVNLESIPTISHSVNSLNYKLLFNADHAGDDFPFPPHLIIRNYSAGSNNTQNLVLGGLSLYTSSYSDYHGDLDLKASDITTTGNISPSRTSIIDSALGSNELPLEKTSFSDATSIYGKGLTLTIHQTDELSPDSSSRAFLDTKYLIRHISDNIITIEGKVLAYGLCTTSRNAADWSVTTKLVNIAESDFDEWPADLSNYYLAVNPFGLLFDDLNNGQTVKAVYNNGDPIELLPIDSFSTTANEAIITSNSISSSFWRKIFPTWVQTDDLTDDDDVAYTYPHPLKAIPFYIIEVASVGTSGSPEATSITGSPYGTFDPKWIGQFPDFFEIGGQIYAAGPYIANSSNLPSSSYIQGFGSQSEDALLPLPTDESSIGYSVTFPYVEDVNDLSSLEWLDKLMSGLGSDMTNLDLTEDTDIVIYDNPCDKYRARFENDGSTYHQFNIIEALSVTDSPENIMKNIHYTSFDSIGDSVQIHISEKASLSENNKFKYLSFIYGVDTESASNVSSSCELELKAHSNNFVIAKEAPVIDLISSITLDSTGSDAQIGDTLESIYSYEFDNPLSFNDFLLRRTGGDSSAHINNFVLFNDMCVYGRCLNPMYAFRDNATNFCQIDPDGYFVIDLGYAKYVHNIEFIVSEKSSEQANFDNNEISFSVSVSDPNISSEFNEINNIRNDSSSIVSTNINRTCKYILIKPTNSNITLYVQKLIVNVGSFDVIYYPGDARDEFLPSTTGTDPADGTIGSPVTQPDNYAYAAFPYINEKRCTTLNPRSSTNGYSNLYIPIGSPTTAAGTPDLFVSTTPSSIIETATSITQFAFNIKQSNNSQISSNDSYLFKLYSTTGTDPHSDLRYDPSDGSPNDFTERTTILATPYSREPEEGYYTISSLGENKIYLNTSDIIFANNNLKGWVARLDIFKDLYAIIKKSGISSNGESWIEIQGSTAGLGLISGGRMYIEKSNVVSFPAFNATWLRLEYLNTTVPIDIFGLKVFTPILDNSNSPVDVVSNSNFGVLGWDIKINYVQD